MSNTGVCLFLILVLLYGSIFTLYKFRTMRSDAEKGGAQWAAGFSDPRITALGKLLRWTHLDELPQLLNITRGDLSFVGPRPERPEFVEKLKEQVPYYEARLLVSPGLPDGPCSTTAPTRTLTT